jgi:hypothetical protein
MADKKQEQYEIYFKEILDELEKEFAKSNEYSKTIDAEIEKFTEYANSKGGQHYLTEHIKNAIALQSQRQSIIKDKFSIKKAILDYTFKDNDEGTEQSLFKELQKLVQGSKEKIEKSNKTHEEIATKIEDTSLDAEIDELLEDYPDEDDE